MRFHRTKVDSQAVFIEVFRLLRLTARAVPVKYFKSGAGEPLKWTAILTTVNF